MLKSGEMWNVQCDVGEGCSHQFVRHGVVVLELLGVPLFQRARRSYLTFRVGICHFLAFESIDTFWRNAVLCVMDFFL